MFQAFGNGNGPAWRLRTAGSSIIVRRGECMSERAITIDLHFMGYDEVIASFLVATPGGGFVLLESGPGSTLDALEAGIGAAGFRLADLRGVFVTHVHLDHAGAAGELARRTGADVFVHPAGVRHIADPSRLLASAARLYGSMMDTMWGRMEPVPEEKLHAVEHGETVTIDGLGVTGWHTPGHASHHVAWQVGSEVATGDIGGLRMPRSSHVIPPTPPPDIDIGLWKASLDTLRGLGVERLLVTHFGAHSEPSEHLDQLEARLDAWWELACNVLDAGGDAGTLEAALTELDDGDMAATGMAGDVRARYRAACPMPMNAAGLVRAWTVQDRGKDLHGGNVSATRRD